MTKISENEFEKICRGIVRDRDSIIKHNPVGSETETLYWMLMSVIISYLSVTEEEIPCFPGAVSADTYREAIKFFLKDRKEEPFDEDEYLEYLTS